MIFNWIKSVKYFVTFEEITKSDLDVYFEKINKEKHTANGLEWSTAQLGHFWIELRIKNANPANNLNDLKKEAFINNDSMLNGEEKAKYSRKESEENRLEEDEDDEVMLHK